MRFCVLAGKRLGAAIIGRPVIIIVVVAVMVTMPVGWPPVALLVAADDTSEKALDEKSDTSTVIREARKALLASEFDRAAVLVEPLAKKGHSGSLLLLGELWANGWGREKLPDQAFMLYQRAAWHGCVMAQYRLGNAYSHGVGVGKDFVQAWAWYGLAAPHFAAAKRFQHLIARNMSPYELARAQEKRGEHWHRVNEARNVASAVASSAGDLAGCDPVNQIR